MKTKIKIKNNFRNNKLGQGLPVNVVVMLILGIILFGLGFSLFSKFSESGEKQISDLSNRVQNDISNLECSSQEGWICSPTFKLQNTKSKIFNIFLTNNGDSSDDFKIDLNLKDFGGGVFGLENTNCGSIVINYFSDSVNIKSGASASIPIEVLASRVTKTPCSFVTTTNIKNPTSLSSKKTSVIIRVE